MDAGPLLGEILKAMRKRRLEAVLIGDAAAALHGAPVTTLDFDFMFRETQGNLRKLKAVSRDLEAVILRPFYPVSKLYRMVNDDRGLQADYMPVIHGVRSFNSLRSRAIVTDIAGQPVLLAALSDIVTGKRAGARPRGGAARKVLKRTPMKSSKSHPKSRPQKKRQEALAALPAESDRQLGELIRRRLALPMAKRTHFLRVRQPGGGSCL